MSDYTDVLLNTQTLISCSSVTPDDGNSHEWLINALESLGYTCTEINHDDVKNFIAIPENGLNKETILFVGHTDVVPANSKEWTFHPFEPTWDNQILYGRGAVDMKSSIAAMLAAVATTNIKKNDANIAFLLTSNEEGESNFGVEYVLKNHPDKFKTIRKVLIGEPTSKNNVGDTIKVGRRGSLNLKIKIQGKSGHVAYPSDYNNPLDPGIQIATMLKQTIWGNQCEHFDRSHMTIVSINTNSDVFNSSPSICEIKINWRFNPSITINDIKETVNTICKNAENESFSINCIWGNQAKPFYNSSLTFAKDIQKTIASQYKQQITFSTSGGTSDARFFDTNHFEIVELGPKNYSAHKVDEHISKNDLIMLKQLYLSIIHAEINSYSNQDHQV